MKTGQKIRRCREWKNYTQEYVASQLGMSTSNYSKLERDEVALTFNRVQEIADILDIPVIDILSYDEKQIFNFSHQSHSQGYNIYQQNNYISQEINHQIDEIKTRIQKIEDLLEKKSKNAE